MAVSDIPIAVLFFLSQRSLGQGHSAMAAEDRRLHSELGMDRYWRCYSDPCYRRLLLLLQQARQEAGHYLNAKFTALTPCASLTHVEAPQFLSHTHSPIVFFFP